MQLLSVISTGLVCIHQPDKLLISKSRTFHIDLSRSGQNLEIYQKNGEPVLKQN